MVLLAKCLTVMMNDPISIQIVSFLGMPSWHAHIVERIDWAAQVAEAE
jgi:hypothetical protein